MAARFNFPTHNLKSHPPLHIYSNKMSVLTLEQQEQEGGSSTSTTSTSASPSPSHQTRRKKRHLPPSSASETTSSNGRSTRRVKPPLLPSLPTPPPQSTPHHTTIINHTTGTQAALILSNWVANVLLADPSPETITMLGLVVQAGGKPMPSHTHINLLISILQNNSNPQLRLEVVRVLSTFSASSLPHPHISTLVTHLRDPCEKVRLSTLHALTGPSYLPMMQPFVPHFLAGLEDTSASIRKASARASVRLAEAGLLTPQDIHQTIAPKLRCRSSSSIREAALNALCLLRASTRVCFQTKRRLEIALIQLHEIVATLTVGGREPCVGVRVLGLQFLSTLPQPLCHRHVGVVLQRLKDSRGEVREAALEFVREKVDKEGVLGKHVHVEVLIGLLQENCNHTYTHHLYKQQQQQQQEEEEDTVTHTLLKALRLVPTRALEPFASDLAALLRRSTVTHTHTHTPTHIGLLELLGKMRTPILLPLVEDTLAHTIFAPLAAPRRAVDALLVAMAEVALLCLKNVDIKRACVCKLVETLTSREAQTHTHRHTQEGEEEEERRRERCTYQVRALMLLGKLGGGCTRTHAHTHKQTKTKEKVSVPLVDVHVSSLLSLVEDEEIHALVRLEGVRALMSFSAAAMKEQDLDTLATLLVCEKEGEEGKEEQGNKKRSSSFCWRAEARKEVFFLHERREEEKGKGQQQGVVAMLVEAMKEKERGRRNESKEEEEEEKEKKGRVEDGRNGEEEKEKELSSEGVDVKEEEAERERTAAAAAVEIPAEEEEEEEGN